MDGILYFECESGISGDMAVAAMLGLGADFGKVEKAISSLGLNIGLKAKKVVKSGLEAWDFDVILEESTHDHDSEYLYGEKHHEHHGRHRHYPEIRSIIEGAEMTENARNISLRILEILAEAEAEAHGVKMDEVHFHEVGALDSIADIIALGVCLDDLSPEGVCFSELCEGTGTVRCQHGILPIPVPAVANIAKAHRIPLRITSSKGEYVTPTGAAFAAATRNVDRPGSFIIERIGLGAGKRESERSGILRAMIVSPKDSEDRILKLECNVDDCTGEAMGFAMERLFEAGARDVSFAPVFMKKNRPAHLLTVICMPGDRERMEDIIFRETTTIGIRRILMDRTVLDRGIRLVDTQFGKISVKVCTRDGLVRAYPEYEDVAEAARRCGVPFREVYDEAVAASHGR